MSEVLICEIRNRTERQVLLLEREGRSGDVENRRISSAGMFWLDRVDQITMPWGGSCQLLAP
jgi:hypothetical protein